MKICGYTYSFFRQLEAGQTTSLEVVKFLVEEGVNSVELADPYLHKDEFVPVRDLLRDSGVQVACYDIYGEFCRRDPAVRTSQLDNVWTALERAAAVGAAQVLLLPGPVDDGVGMDTAREWYIAGLRNCLGPAHKLGLTITIANLGYQAALCGTSEHMELISTAIGPDLLITYDVGNFLLAGEQSIPALDRLAKRVVHVHLKDWLITPHTGFCLEDGGYPGLDGRCYRGVPLGQGVVDLERATRHLHQLRYTGALSVEYEGIGDPKEAVHEGIEFLRRLIPSQAAID